MTMTKDALGAAIDQPRPGTVAEFDGYWLHLRAAGAEPGALRRITGKYLFFSADPQALVDLAGDEITEHGFISAKVNSRILGSGTEHVLCLYAEDSARRFELKSRYEHRAEVKYRWWKTNTDTSEGRYSGEFLRTLGGESTRTLARQEHPNMPCMTSTFVDEHGAEWDCVCGAGQTGYESHAAANAAALDHLNGGQ